MLLRCGQDIYGFYKCTETPSIEQYPVRLPRILSPDDLDPFEYTGIDPTREIRLLELLPPRQAQNNSNELLKCRLHKCILTEAMEYEALSYTWGKIQRHLPISIVWKNGLGDQVEEALFATPQLMMALRRLRFATSSRMLWIDQLCINQENNDEKGPQIQLMGDIYRTAREVVIWLGEDHLNWYRDSHIKEAQWSQILANTIKLIVENGRNTEKDVSLAQTLFDIHPTNHLDTPRRIRLHVISELLNRPWFTRAWVFQEASLAKRLKVQYGETEIQFEDLHRLCDAVFQMEKMAGIYRIRSLAMDTAGFEMMQFIQQTREELHPSSVHDKPVVPRGSLFLCKLLQVLRRVRCYDQRDLIFAFLAFQKGEGITASAEIYDRSTEEVWRHAAECIIKSSQSLDIFAALSGDKPRDMKLPSWVPYWEDCYPYSRPIATPVTKFCASKDTLHVWNADLDPGKLRVKGKIIDEVFGASSIYSGPSRPFGTFMSFKHYTDMFICMELLVDDARRYYFGDPDVNKAYGEHTKSKIQNLPRDLMRIVLADGAMGPKQPLRDDVCDMLDLNSRSKAICQLRINTKREDMTPDEIEIVDKYENLENLIVVAEHKQLFSTKHFQHGMASNGVKVGDQIAILHGSNVPCLLRAVDEAKKEYRVLSQCYLDGWMYGKQRADIPRLHPHRKWWEEEPDDLVLV